MVATQLAEALPDLQLVIESVQLLPLGLKVRCRPGWHFPYVFYLY